MSFIRSIVLLSLVAAFAPAPALVASAHEGDKYHQENFAPHPLIHAALHGDAAEVKRLLDGGANPNAAKKDGDTALMWAAKKGRAKVVKVLLAAKANPNAADNNGETALMWAAVTGGPEIVKMLLAAKANPNAARKADGGAALDFAKQVHNYAPTPEKAKGYQRIIKMLRAAGAK